MDGLSIWMIGECDASIDLYGERVKMNLSRRCFLYRLALTGMSTLLGSELLSAYRRKETPPPTGPLQRTRTPVHTEAAVTPATQAKEVTLPPPRIKGSLSLEEALLWRRSVRMYKHGPLNWQDIAQLFWAAQGVTRSWGGRTAPSAGALYPLEMYVATADGVYHYLPSSHSVEVTISEDIRRALWAAGLYQEALAQAPLIFVITAVYRRTEMKYGTRAERYVELEAGHAAQNLLLQAVALGLGAVVIGAFYDDAVSSALHLPAAEKPLYLIPTGLPAE